MHGLRNGRVSNFYTRMFWEQCDSLLLTQREGFMK
jgi:hypothetical protein